MGAAVAINRNLEHAVEHTDAAVLAELSLPANPKSSPGAGSSPLTSPAQVTRAVQPQQHGFLTVFQYSNQLLDSSVTSDSCTQKSAYPK